MEKLDIVITLKEFYENYDVADPRIRDEFYDFVRKTSIYSFIGDSKPENIVYTTQRGWIILDGNGEIKRHSSERKAKFRTNARELQDTIFEHYTKTMPNKVKLKIRAIIQSTRGGGDSCSHYYKTGHEL